MTIYLFKQTTPFWGRAFSFQDAAGQELYQLIKESFWANCYVIYGHGQERLGYVTFKTGLLTVTLIISLKDYPPLMCRIKGGDVTVDGDALTVTLSPMATHLAVKREGQLVLEGQLHGQGLKPFYRLEVVDDWNPLLASVFALITQIRREMIASSIN